ncbi:hypothetical protein SAMN05216345_111163 [Cupriavidus sp. YR651]|uniref:recombination directionality factor n=1 Tax=Cupriavidus sp. YR651 TaxID=1855315 RepID=UPI000882D681|nr:hypothetical protein [Cupriavidus sp. YR651]SDD58831.1 hypothetical protein SAMN05216345_111163 [Cupriavidus sp. YR651]
MQHAPITYSEFSSPRSVIEERPMRPPTIGKIRPGIKVLTKKARDNEEAVRIHDRMLAQAASFDSIAREIARCTGISNALVPKNTPFFTCRGSDFTNPAVADEILQIYGEDRGDGNGRRLWRFPVVFAFDDWLRNIPNQLVTYSASGRKYFSEYGADGLRYCKTYAPPQRDARASRAKRNWGGRTVILRQDDDIHDGHCDPHVCPQYQDGACNLKASFFVALPDIRGLGLIEIPTTSIYVLQKAHAAMQTVALARGRLVGVKFFMSKIEQEVSRIDDSGNATRQMQWLITLDAEIDLAALLDGSDKPQLTYTEAEQAVAVLEGQRSVGEREEDPSPSTQAISTDHVRSDSSEQDSEADLAHQFNELGVQLGMDGEAERADLRAFLQASFGKGWTKRPQDVRRVLDDMRTALANPMAFREQVKAIAAELSP